MTYWVFFLSYWDFFLSYWYFFLNLLKSGRFPLKDWLFLQYSSLKWGISAITVYFLFIWVNFCSYFSKILLKPWVFCLSFELFSWGLSFLVLEFFSNGPKKSLPYEDQNIFHDKLSSHHFTGPYSELQRLRLSIFSNICIFSRYKKTTQSNIEKMVHF